MIGSFRKAITRGVICQVARQVSSEACVSTRVWKSDVTPSLPAPKCGCYSCRSGAAYPCFEISASRCADSMSACIISFTNVAKSVFAVQPSLAFALLASPRSVSTSAGRKYLGSMHTIFVPGFSGDACGTLAITPTSFREHRGTGDRCGPY